MTLDSTTLAAIAALFSAVSTGIAAYATLISPKRAAYFLKEAEAEQRRSAEKLEIFKTLMKYRNSGWPEEAIAACNLIDVVWADNKDVRDSWAKYYRAALQSDGSRSDLLANTYEDMLTNMARDLGLDHQLGPDVYDRAFYSAEAHARQLSTQQFLSAQQSAEDFPEE